MTKPRKSELKDYLLHSIQILKRNLDYPEYTYFILTLAFFYYENIQSIQGNIEFHINRSESESDFKKNHSLNELIKKVSEIENNNPLLKNVLSPAIPRNKISDSMLDDLFEQLNQLHENTLTFSNAENFSQAYEYWISQLAKLTVKQGLSFYTSRSVIRLMVGLVKPQVTMSLYDPSSGTGGMFIESANYIGQHGGDVNSIAIYGNEVAPDIWAICKMNLLVHGLGNSFVEQEDSLLNTTDLSKKFDLILQSIPLPKESTSKREIYQLSEIFLKNLLSRLADEGRAALLMPNSVFQEEAQELWSYIVGNDWLEAVIGLPARLLYGTSYSSCIFILNKRKPDSHKGEVLFLRAVNNAMPYTRHNDIDEKDIIIAIDAFESWKRIPEYANVISNSTIAEQGYKLNVDKYLSMEDKPSNFDITSALKRYRLAAQEREIAIERLMKSLETYYNSKKVD